jgi:hypothetical protein
VRRCLLACGIVPAALSAVALDASEPAAMTPARDLEGDWMMRVSPNLPNVLILGDSISIGYTREVRRLLHGKANVFRPMNRGDRQPDNCGDTRIGLQHIDAWLGTNRWDVIHFNWGLWDLCYRNPEADTQGHRDKINGTLSVTPEDYERNLEQLVTRLKATGATLIWGSTTVVPEGEAGRFVGDEIKYNAIAARIMEREGIRIDPLYELTRSFQGQYSVGPGDVHYTRAGYQALARQVAAQIEPALTNNREPPASTATPR